ncbi:MAG: DUF5674 family protein [Candidatus Saccharibacteria bacterium]
MKQVTTISVKDLNDMAAKMYDPLVKAVVDISKKLVVVDAEMHVDEEQYLLENGSKQDDLWGFNMFPGQFGTDRFIEFDSMINIRPRQHNNTRTVESSEIQQQIAQIVAEIVHE